MEASYHIRSAEPDDLPQVIHLWQSVGLVDSFRSDNEVIEALKQQSTLILMVAECKSKVVGTALGGTDGWWGWLYRLAVMPEYQKQGIGEALVREVESQLKHRGVRYINTITNRRSIAASRVFEKAGWSLDEDHVRHIKRI